MAGQEYKKSLEDEIDWKVIDQLHSSTVNFSSTSLEIKKLFFVLIGIAVPALIKLTAGKLDFSLFVTLYLLTFTFWFLDSFTYYYQEKLREKMDKHFSQIKYRNKEILIVTNGAAQEFTIEKDRTEKKRRWRSVFNSSLWLYYLVLLLISIGLVLFLTQVIK